MTKRGIKQAFVVTGIFYATSITCGILFQIFDSTNDNIYYETYKDLIPILVALPITWLGYCLQQRSSYLQQLRILWSNLVETIQAANQYTHLKEPTNEQYSAILEKISISIDEVRGVFRNLNESDDDIGLYPFEPLKNIWDAIAALEPESKTDEKRRSEIRIAIFSSWKEMRAELLKEFDRHEPTNPVTPFRI